MIKMNQFVFKGSTQPMNILDRKQPYQDEKSRQALEDFKKFCNFILAYEATEEAKRVGRSLKRDKGPNSPNGSSGSSTSNADSLNDVEIPVKRKYNKHKNAQNEEYDSDDESWSLVTCFCRKPFAGRPMIECSSCNIWIHLSCAKIRRSNIPDLFICPTCRDSHSNQIKTIVNGFDNKNNFKSMKQTKTKTKRRSSISDNKAASKAHAKDKKVEEP